MKDTGLIPIGIGLFTTVAGYLYGQKSGETRAFKALLKTFKAMYEADHPV